MTASSQPSSMAQPSQSGGRNAYIDTLRGWSIFGVVCVHFGGSFVNAENAWSLSFYLGLGLNQLFTFAVPFFIFLSGYLAGGGSAKAPITLGAYYRGRLWRIGVPYLAVSVASFFLLNHAAAWLALPDNGTRISWLAVRLFYYGVEPTLYFIPLIIQLYILQPALKALPHWLSRLAPHGRGPSPAQFVLALTLLFLILHVTLGLKCYGGTLNYYDWGRPNALFWLVYFFSGLHFRTIVAFCSRRGLMIAAWLALLAAITAMVWNGLYLTDRAAVGAKFELSRIDYAYVRPEMIVYDLAMVVLLSMGIALGRIWRAGLASFLGRFTLEIYLWHILVLYFGAWRYAEVLASCREIPELIVIICAATCLAIAGIVNGVARSMAFIRRYRLTIIRVA